MSLSPPLLLPAFARALTAMRTERGITREQLVQRCGLTHQGVMAMEAGAHVPTLEELVALAQGLGCEAADLIDRTLREATLDEARDRCDGAA